jgi:pimeloyl-ACP methyl ester carboxylesterase
MNTMRGKYAALLVLVAVVIAGTLLAASCGPKPALPASVVPANAKAGELSGMQKCPFEAAGSKTVYEAECGTLIVPENRDKSGSRLIALPVVRIPATGSNSQEAVFLLSGGPGGSNLGFSPPAWLIENHDFVMVGYRGVEGSVVLTCPEVSQLLKVNFGKDLWNDQTMPEYSEAVRQCAARWQGAGVDLDGYTATNVIEDMEAARQALGYSRINLLSHSYGTRVAQIYAYMHPESLQRMVLVGVNPPGHFIWSPAALDGVVRRLSDLCAKDSSCSSRTDDLAQTMYAVNHNMPKSWLFFNIDPDTVRLGTHLLFFSNRSMGMVIDAYLAAGEGDPSGLAMMSTIMPMMFPADQIIMGDEFSKGGSLDGDLYRGIDSISLGNSILGAPMSELVWPIAMDWPVAMVPQNLRQLQATDVDMLLVNGTVDASTPLPAVEEVKPYFHNAQIVVLPEFSHVEDVEGLQPAAFERLITSYYDTGIADSSAYVYEPVSFKPQMDLIVVARLLVAAMVIVPALILLGIVLVIRRIRRRAVAGQS